MAYLKGFSKVISISAVCSHRGTGTTIFFTPKRGRWQLMSLMMLPGNNSEPGGGFGTDTCRGERQAGAQLGFGCAVGKGIPPSWTH